jgi:hypothetical protein
MVKESYSLGGGTGESCGSGLTVVSISPSSSRTSSSKTGHTCQTRTNNPSLQMNVSESLNRDTLFGGGTLGTDWTDWTLGKFPIPGCPH